MSISIFPNTAKPGDILFPSKMMLYQRLQDMFMSQNQGLHEVLQKFAGEDIRSS